MFCINLFMIYNFAKRVVRSLNTTLRHSYGELVYTNTLSHQSSFDKVPTYRLIDLDGQLQVKDHVYDTKLLLKMLKTMIFVDEMDTILLRVKGQGNSVDIKVKFHSI